MSKNYTSSSRNYISKDTKKMKRNVEEWKRFSGHVRKVPMNIRSALACFSEPLYVGPKTNEE